MTQIADGHLGLDLNCRWSFRLVLMVDTSDVTWSPQFTLVCTLNPELICRSIITDVQLVCRFAKVTIYLEFAFV